MTKKVGPGWPHSNLRWLSSEAIPAASWKAYCSPPQRSSDQDGSVIRFSKPEMMLPSTARSNVERVIAFASWGSAPHSCHQNCPKIVGGLQLK